KELDEIAPGIVLVSLPGHSRGHACVAVEADEADEPLARRGTGSAQRWLLHCGDAFYHRGTLDGSPVPRFFALFESFGYNRKQVRENHLRLQELYHRGDPDLHLFCSHDPITFKRAVVQE